jgi:hypothetical protein
LTSKKFQSAKPKDTVGMATRKPLSLQYAELVRLREAVQKAAAVQSRKRQQETATAKTTTDTT